MVSVIIISLAVSCLIYCCIIIADLNYAGCEDVVPGLDNKVVAGIAASTCSMEVVFPESRTMIWLKRLLVMFRHLMLRNFM